MDVLAHRNKAPVPDVKFPAVSVDLDASAADERSVFVFDDEILIVSEPFGDFDLGTAVMRSAASRRHDRTHDVVIPEGAGRCQGRFELFDLGVDSAEPIPVSRWSVRSVARTNDLDDGAEGFGACLVGVEARRASACYVVVVQRLHG